MNYETSVRKESALYPGVFYTLHRMSEGRRMKLRTKLQESNSRMRNVIRELRSLDEMNKSEENNPQILTRIEELRDQMEEIATCHMDPEWVRWGVKKLEGLEIDGQVADVELLIEEGPPGLYEEILTEIKMLATLNGEEEKNSELPTISGEQEGGTTNSTTAESASAPEDTSGETADSTSPSE